MPQTASGSAALLSVVRINWKEFATHPKHGTANERVCNTGNSQFRPLSSLPASLHDAATQYIASEPAAAKLVTWVPATQLTSNVVEAQHAQHILRHHTVALARDCLALPFKERVSISK